MIIVIQRINHANCIVNGSPVSSVKKGILALVSIEKNDNEKDRIWCINKIINLRIFPDKNQKFDLSIRDIRGEILVVSQFTLAGSCNKGNRPSFDRAMPPDEAKLHFDLFIKELTKTFPYVKTGIFQEYMKINLENDGPVTFIIDSKKRV